MGCITSERRLATKQTCPKCGGLYTPGTCGRCGEHVSNMCRECHDTRGHGYSWEKDMAHREEVAMLPDVHAIHDRQYHGIKWGDDV